MEKDVEGILNSLLTPNDQFELPAPIQFDMQKFADAILGQFPESAIFREMGLSSIDPERAYHQLKRSFRLI